MKFMPFFRFLCDFKLIFRLIFLLKIAKKWGFFIPQTPRMTRHGCRRGARDQRRCDVALKPRGRAAHGPREAQVARTRGRRPRGCPCGAPRGRGVVRWRAHGLVGHGKYIGAVTQMRTAPLSFIDIIFILFFRVGLCSHTVLMSRWRGGCIGVGFYRGVLIAWSTVHTIEITAHA